MSSLTSARQIWICIGLLCLLFTSTFASHIARPLDRHQALARTHLRQRSASDQVKSLQVENKRLMQEYSEKLAVRERMLETLSSGKHPLAIRDDSSVVKRQNDSLANDINALQNQNQILRTQLAALELLINDLLQALASAFHQGASAVPVTLSSTPAVVSVGGSDGSGGNSPVASSAQAPAPQGAQPTSGPVVAVSTPAPGSFIQSSFPTLPVSLVTSTILSNLSITPTLSSTTMSSASAASTSISSSNATSGSFDPMSSRNVAVYYGQTSANVDLSAVCNDSGVDIVVLAFVNDLFSGGGYPTINFGSHCGGPSSAQTAAGATGLLSCPQLASDISSCQQLGKKVLLSLGGAVAQSSIPDAASAQTLATNLWNLFGDGTGAQNLRPFGDVSVDGFDIDNEDHSQDNWATFISKLRSNFRGASKPYFMSAAPQCPRPDASIPLSSMQNDIDFTWVQFYDNTPCNIGSGGFLQSVQAWSEDLSSGTFTNVGNGVSSPRLYVGGFSYSPGYGSGYLPIDQFDSAIEQVKQLNLPNFGGVMLWDGAEGELDVSNGQTFMQSVKSTLGS